MSPTQLIQFETSLHQAGLRTTKTRQAIFHTLYTAHSPLTIRQLVQAIPNSHFVSVYRSVHLLTRAGCITQIPIGFQNAFELSEPFKLHHHHAICEFCSRTIEVREDKIEALLHEIADTAEFEVFRHHFEMYGRCKACRLAASDPRTFPQEN